MPAGPVLELKILSMELDVEVLILEDCEGRVHRAPVNGITESYVQRQVEESESVIVGQMRKEQRTYITYCGLLFVLSVL